MRPNNTHSTFDRISFVWAGPRHKPTKSPIRAPRFWPNNRAPKSEITLYIYYVNCLAYADARLRWLDICTLFFTSWVRLFASSFFIPLYIENVWKKIPSCAAAQTRTRDPEVGGVIERIQPPKHKVLAVFTWNN